MILKKIKNKSYFFIFLLNFYLNRFLLMYFGIGFSKLKYDARLNMHCCSVVHLCQVLFNFIVTSTHGILYLSKKIHALLCNLTNHVLFNFQIQFHDFFFLII